ncbi:SDR family NAD(P)-dependent oxidoreductase, partial [Nocardia sp. NPDC046473]|uniref:SDR family NAD(P)-dependent oxidoreductase n=1 Tax=Nocardia sp. NPDC046473 TaxID=3155733 RepID=UPI0034112E6D
DAVGEVTDYWQGVGRKVKRLSVSHAFHSPRMDPMLADFEQVLNGVELCVPRVAVVSDSTGELLTAEQATSPGYWVEHIIRPVRFHDATTYLADAGVTRFVEVGPSGTLAAIMGMNLADRGVVAVPALRADRDEPEALLSAVAELFVSGREIDWTAVLRDMGLRGHRVPLPTYAFQRSRFWLQDTNDASAEPAAGDAEFWDLIDRGDVRALADALTPSSARLRPEDWEPVLPALASWRAERNERTRIDGWRYRVAWKPRTNTPTSALSGRWLLVTAESGSADASCAEALRGHGADVVVLRRPGAAGPVARDVWGAVLEAAAVGGAVSGVVSLLGMDERPDSEHPAVPVGTAETLGLVQGLGDAGIEAPLWCLTRGAVSVAPGDALTHPAQAMIWGLGRVVALEQPQRWGGLIDLPEPVDAGAWERVCGILADDTSEDQLAVRPSGVFLRRLLPAPATTTEQHDWTPTGTVLISGGTGGLGAHAARWIARFGTAHVMLLSRRGPAAPGAAALIEELAAAGTSAEAVACDLADRERLAEVLAGIPADRPLTTVIHAAAQRGDAAIDALDSARLGEVLASKKTGAWNLHELTTDLPVSSFILFSSGTGVWGGGGQATHATANAFADALAGYRRTLGLPATAIAWGPWRSPEDQGERDGTVAELDRRGVASMPPELAVRALEQAVRNRDTAVAVVDMDWARFHATFAVARPRPLLHDIPAVEALLADLETPQEEIRSALAETLAGLDEKDRHTAVLKMVVHHAAAVLGHSDTAAVPTHLPFRDLGFDSLTAVELRNRMKEATGLPLPATLVFDYPVPAAIADHVIDLLDRPDSEFASVYESIASLEGAVADYRPNKTGADDISDVIARLRSVLAQYESMTNSDSGRRSAGNDDISSVSVSELIGIIDDEFGSIPN